jgi:hypothetical protein
MYLATFILGLLSYPILLLIFGRSVNLDFVGFFARQYQSGFMAEPIITPGPVLVVLPLIAAISAVSSGILLANRFGRLQIEEHLKRSLYTASFFSVWSAFGFAYYLNRSYASGQMQILFLPLSIALASFAYYLIESNSDLTLSGLKTFGSASWNRVNRVKTLSALAVGLVLTIPIASTIAFPQPNIELKRITAKDPNQSFPKPSNQRFIEGLDSIESADKLFYFGTSSNYMELRANLQSLSLFNSPFDFTIGSKLVEAGCNYVSEVNPQRIVVNDEGAAITQAFPESKLCNKYLFSPENSRILQIAE